MKRTYWIQNKIGLFEDNSKHTLGFYWIKKQSKVQFHLNSSRRIMNNSFALRIQSQSRFFREKASILIESTEILKRYWDWQLLSRCRYKSVCTGNPQLLYLQRFILILLQVYRLQSCSLKRWLLPGVYSETAIVNNFRALLWESFVFVRVRIL